MAKSIPDQLSMFNPTTSEDSITVTGSPASADGRTRLPLLDGLPLDAAGPAAAPVNRSAWRDEARVPTIPATFGLRGFRSSASADLQSCLVNRLRAVTDCTGSILFSLTWKVLSTPSGASCSLLRASALRTGDTASTSWPTTTGRDGTSSRRHGYMDKGHPGTTLHDAALLASWPTCQTRDGNRGGQAKRTTTGRSNLDDHAMLAGAWPTPIVPNGGRSSNPETMTATGQTTDGRKHTVTLEHVAKFATWATPTPRDHKDGDCTTQLEQGTIPINALLGRQALLTSGTRPSGSPASTGGRGQLNPEHSRWLMGYPPVWSSCAATATQLLRHSRRSS